MYHMILQLEEMEKVPWTVPG